EREEGVCEKPAAVEQKRMVRVFPFEGRETGAEALALIPVVSGVGGAAAVNAFYLALADRFFSGAEELLLPAARRAFEESRGQGKVRFSRPAARLEVTLRGRETVRGHPALRFCAEYALFLRGRPVRRETAESLWLIDRGLLVRYGSGKGKKAKKSQKKLS
ncbi:MAG: hypothetical protein II192_00050, partial [Clostridia bacterium]|nr:hypothetical protein [Clostridia bacterium]